MKNLPRLPDVRNRERGAVAMLVAFMWTALFGMAVFAVDFGYLYTKRRGVQAVADSAVRAGMKDYTPTTIGAAASRAIQVASANGYTNSGSTSVQTDVSVPNQLKVTVTRTYPTFFGSLFGLNAKPVSGVTIGRYFPGASGAAIHANSASGCVAAWGTGFAIQGDQILTINGDVESNGQLGLGFMRVPTYFPLGPSRINGSAKTPCAPITPGPMNPSLFPITTETNAGSPYADPLAANNLATLGALCTTGNTGAPLNLNPLWNPVDVVNNCQGLPPGVYCSNGNIAVAPPAAPSICPSNVTFVTPGRITIGAAGNVRLSAAAGVPGQIIAFAGAADANCGGQAINMGAAGFYDLNGAFYAPNGCVNTGGGGGGFGPGGFTLNGQVVGQHINMAMSNAMGSGPWTFNGPGGGGGSSWSLIQ